ncbi:uncharacterized protein PHALS_12949 [Plasmopara halstedii]|uniref:HAD-like domain n=1 Tax=Plasmopara halstedii TaxID=4781 RepID=A0A0P1ANJ1_PLAHL|nr:uncharacterized protein PHALS_12949 [Plasmopara halstedii]CEG42695.1 hypothetical protein PHALS_12949 [Plasmopara halstedii]|eukprot:XP_024579064.1 hypothetical protein PHALS_12949 [Plasmopara halstedii]
MGVSRIVSTAVQNAGSISHASEKHLVTSPLIILDWDDTLFPNTHLAKLGFSSEDKSFVISQDGVSTLKELAEEVEKFLIACLNIGTCCIVTNGQSGWVERSCKRFLPNVVPLLEKITIISARSCFEKIYPDRPIEWKIAVYQDLLAKHGCMQMSLSESRDDCCQQQEHEIQQVIALGDSQGDRCAIQYVARRTLNTQLKSIKLLDNPTITQLQKQLMLLGVYLVQLSSHNETLDLELSTEMLQ